MAFWGGVQITVPEGFEVELEGFSFMGGRSLRLRDLPIVPGSPRIRVRGFSVMGGIEVRSKPSRSGKQIAQAVVGGVQVVLDALPSRSGASTPIDLAALAKDIRRQMPVSYTHLASSPPARPLIRTPPSKSTGRSSTALSLIHIFRWSSPAEAQNSSLSGSVATMSEYTGTRVRR